jgi:hypothetical protein
MHRPRQRMVAEPAKDPLVTLYSIVAMGRVHLRSTTSEPGVFRPMVGLSGSHGENGALIETGDIPCAVVQAEVGRCRAAARYAILIVISPCFPQASCAGRSSSPSTGSACRSLCPSILKWCSRTSC